MARNWQEMGIEFQAEKVKEGGVEFHHDAFIPIPRDLTKIRDHFGDEAVLGALDGSSWRVIAQRVNRRELSAGRHSPDHLQEQVYLALRGVRASGGTRTVKVYVLIGGVEFRTDPDKSDADNLVALRQAARAAAIDSGMSPEVAKQVSELMSL